MVIGLLKETVDDNRVALMPEHIIDLLKNEDLKVLVEDNAGIASFINNEQYKDAGAQILNKKDILDKSDLIVKVNGLDVETIKNLDDSKVLVSVFNPFHNLEKVKVLCDKKISSFSLDLIPRTSSRGQSMDILSSMATVAGYKAVLTAAANNSKFFPMLMTAAGTIKPAKVLILGAGVAGLQAIATAKRLGAVVYAFDVRAAVKEQVESLGGRFVEVEGAKEDANAGGYAIEQSEEYKSKQAQLIHDHAISSDIIITTAQIPGKKAPLLIQKETVESMKSGSVIVDLAASTGGNTAMTKNNETVDYNGIKIIGNSNFPSELSTDASKMFGKNVSNFVKLMIAEQGKLNINFEDELIAGTCLTYEGKVLNERVEKMLN